MDISEFLMPATIGLCVYGIAQWLVPLVIRAGG